MVEMSREMIQMTETNQELQRSVSHCACMYVERDSCMHVDVLRHTYSLLPVLHIYRREKRECQARHYDAVLQ